MPVRIEKLQVGFIGENTYAIVGDAHATTCVLVDPGDESEKIVAWLDSMGLMPILIVATHGHLDHTGAIPGVRKAFSDRDSAAIPGANGAAAFAAANSGRTAQTSPGTDTRARTGLIPLAVHPADATYFGKRGEQTNRELFRAIHATAYFTHFWHFLPEPELLLSDGDLVPGTDFRVIHTPGHSAGSICLYNAGEGILLSGDTLFKDGLGRSDGPDSDPRLLESSLASLVLLPPSTRVFPGHGDETTIGRESRNLTPR